MPPTSLTGKPCAACGYAITVTTPGVVCSVCGKPYHQRCWDGRGSCATPGCPGQPVAAAAAPAGGTNFSPPTAQRSQSYGAAPVYQQETNLMAILALVFAILTGFGGLILGIIALNQIKNSGDSQGGRGLAIAGIVVGGIGTFFALLFFAILLPVFFKARDKARSMKSDSVAMMTCLSNQRELALSQMRP